MKTSICIATGSSLTADDVDYCRGKGHKIYAVKEARFLCPDADVLYAADWDWWDFNKGCPEFTGEKWTCAQESAKKYGLNYIAPKPNIDWSEEQGIVATGGNSGFQTLNLAVLHGADRVILLGYDMGFTNKKHFWTDEFQRPVRDSRYNDWIQKFNRAAPKIKVPVFNATAKSNLECFQKVKLREII